MFSFHPFLTLSFPFTEVFMEILWSLKSHGILNQTWSGNPVYVFALKPEWLFFFFFLNMNQWFKCAYADFQTHQAVSRAIEVLERTSGKTYPSKNKILQAYLAFEALTGHEYTYACVSCGHNPTSVVMDLHKKGVFSMPRKPKSFWLKSSFLSIIVTFVISCPCLNHHLLFL